MMPGFLAPADGVLTTDKALFGLGFLGVFNFFSVVTSNFLIGEGCRYRGASVLRVPEEW